MSLSPSIACDVCGKRGGERITDWFEIESASDSFSIFHESERVAGVVRTSKDICGSRCLCVALERWVNKELRLARAAAAAAAGEQPIAEPIRIGPRITSPAVASAREAYHRGQPKAAKNARALESIASDDTSRILEVFRKAVNR
jgi:hypothetical protein